jgi:hypothetical protein
VTMGVVRASTGKRAAAVVERELVGGPMTEYVGCLRSEA